jgi:hypothetical protein
MSVIGIGLNLLLACLLAAALLMGSRLNKRLKALRDSHDGFAIAVRELNTAAARAEQGLADLRAATDEATDELADRIEKGRALAAKLERLTQQGGRAPQAGEEPVQERRLGALLAAAREGRGKAEAVERPDRRDAVAARLRASFEDDLFEEDAPAWPALGIVGGGRR